MLATKAPQKLSMYAQALKQMLHVDVDLEKSS